MDLNETELQIIIWSLEEHRDRIKTEIDNVNVSPHHLKKFVIKSYQGGVDETEWIIAKFEKALDSKRNQ